jgi:release factor glutamine methyltransferase
MSLTIDDLLRSTAALLGSPWESRWVVSHALGSPADELAADVRTPVSEEVRATVASISARRLAGEPLQYLLGTWAFRTLELRVDARALIPRPETEQVVEFALAELVDQAAAHDRGGRLVAADLGTGTGAIALSLAAEHRGDPDALEVWATDRSPEAIDLLELNREMLASTDPAAARRIRVGRGTWFEALPAALAGGVALVVSNPPYVSEEEWAHLDPVVRDHEPREALVPGPSGFEAIDTLLREAPAWLVPGGSLAVELAPAQAERAVERAEALGYVTPRVCADLAGRPRALVTRTRG